MPTQELVGLAAAVMLRPARLVPSAGNPLFRELVAALVVARRLPMGTTVVALVVKWASIRVESQVRHQPAWLVALGSLPYSGNAVPEAAAAVQAQRLPVQEVRAGSQVAAAAAVVLQ